MILFSVLKKSSIIIYVKESKKKNKCDTLLIKGTDKLLQYVNKAAFGLCKSISGK